MENLKSTYIKLSVFYLCVKSYSFFEIVSSKLIAKQILKNSCNYGYLGIPLIYFLLKY